MISIIYIYIERVKFVVFLYFDICIIKRIKFNCLFKKKKKKKTKFPYFHFTDHSFCNYMC